MLLIVTDEAHEDVAAVDDFELDMAIGDDENDFELSLPDSAPRLSEGCLAYVDGTDFGGVVDSVESVTTRLGTSLSYYGRTWSGILANRVVVPPSGSDRFESRGEANECIRALIAHLGLGDVFSAPMGDSGIRLDYKWERFCDAWHGLLACLKSSGLKPVMRFEHGSVVLSASPSRQWGGDGDDVVDFTIRRDSRPVNHLVCAGSGEGASRNVVHFYADENGKVSHAQSLFGIDEVSALYDYSNAGEDELEEKGAKKLEDYQVEGEVSVSVREGVSGIEVGDTVVGREDRFGIEVAAEIVKKVAKVSHGAARVEYECGQASSTRGLTASSETTGGGHSYYAGDGLSLEGYTFSADVTSEDVDEVRSEAEDAAKAASDASAAAGAAQAAAEAASASAAQKSPLGHTHTSSEVVDLAEWAKKPSKPSYTAAEVGAAPASHTHPYAGSDEPGGPAKSAERLAKAVTITFAGSVRGSVSLDGSQGVTATLEADASGAGFLAAHPVGSYFETSGGSPSGMGGSWELVEAAGRAELWHRVG